MLATVESRKSWRKEKGKIDKVMKEYSGSGKRIWLRGRRPTENRRRKRKRYPQREGPLHVFSLLPNMLFYQLFFSSLRAWLQHQFLEKPSLPCPLLPPSPLSLSISALFTF